MAELETTGAYEAQTPAERHLSTLLEKLPHMQQVQERLEANREAGQILSKYSYVDDLEGDIEQLQAKDPSRDGINPELFEQLLKEKREALTHERTRLAHDLGHSRFSNVAQASQARIPQEEARALEGELARFREDYAYTLSRCQAE